MLRVVISVSLVTVAVSAGSHTKTLDEHFVRQEHDAEGNLFFHLEGVQMTTFIGSTFRDFHHPWLVYDAADEMHGTSAADTFDAGGGNDTIFAGLGTDTVNAGAGDDTIYAQPYGSSMAATATITSFTDKPRATSPSGATAAMT